MSLCCRNIDFCSDRPEEPPYPSPMAGMLRPVPSLLAHLYDVIQMRSLDLTRDDEIWTTGILSWRPVGIDGQFETGIRKVSKVLLFWDDACQIPL